ncbi:DMT family transporter [Microtetraspora sp. NBRC 13810]|uniref:DMT family transporter n=1 Tax=Microtetraspora sp. NBRC 13810 TaxID=3030990 RepID=UPI0033193392
MLRAMAVTAPRPLLGAVLLLFVSAAWGSAFPLMKDLIVRMPVADLLSLRYGVAALVLLAIRPAALRGLSEGTWTRGVQLGLVFGVGQIAQAMALHSLPSPVSGFAVGCNVVMTPLLGLVLLRTRVSMRIWAAVALAAVAMAVFTLLHGMEGGDVSLLALAATLMAAALYAVHTLMLGRMSGERQDGYALTVIQLGTIGVLSGVLAMPGGLTLPSGTADWLVLAHLAVVSCALGFLARTYGQVHIAPVPSAIILSSQPLWVAVLAAVVYGEAITVSVVVGGALVAAAMLLAVVPERSRHDTPDPPDATSREPAGRSDDPSLDAVPPEPGPPEEVTEPSGRSDYAAAYLPPAHRALLIKVSREASKILLALRTEQQVTGRPAPAVGDIPRQGRPAEVSRPPSGGEPLDQMLERAMAVVHERSDHVLSETVVPLIIALDPDLPKLRAPARADPGSGPSGPSCPGEPCAAELEGARSGPPGACAGGRAEQGDDGEER